MTPPFCYDATATGHNKPPMLRQRAQTPCPQDTKQSPIKIRNPKLEIRDKPKNSSPKSKNQNPKRAGLKFYPFWSFRFVSDFEFGTDLKVRLGVFARDIENRC